METQTETKQTNKKEINWDKSLEFVRGIFPKMESELENLLNYLNKVRPSLSIDNYPPRIELTFMPKCTPKGKLQESKERMNYYLDDLYRTSLWYDEENELERNQIKISKIVFELGEKYYLNTIGGLITPMYHPVTNKRIGNKIVRGLGFYTFKPKYKEFVKIIK